MFKDLFKPKRSNQDFTSLNLETPAQKAPADQPAAVPKVPGISEARMAVLCSQPMREEVQRRAKLLRESEHVPKVFFYLVEPTKGILILLKHETQKPILLFSSPFFAQDYLQFSKLNVAIAGVPMESFATTAQKWRANGVDSLVIDRCPRCPVATVVSPQSAMNWDQLILMWSIERGIKNWRAEGLIRHFLSLKGENMQGEMRATLEMLRDHVDCAVPYVHLLIAMLAGMQKDEPGRLAATARLEQFGPNFKGRTGPIELNPETGKEWADSWGRAMIGLLGTYGMLKLQQNPGGGQKGEVKSEGTSRLM